METKKSWFVTQPWHSTDVLGLCMHVERKTVCRDWRAEPQPLLAGCGFVKNVFATSRCLSALILFLWQNISIHWWQINFGHVCLHQILHPPFVQNKSQKCTRPFALQLGGCLSPSIWCIFEKEGERLHQAIVDFTKCALQARNTDINAWFRKGTKTEDGLKAQTTGHFPAPGATF